MSPSTSAQNGGHPPPVGMEEKQAVERGGQGKSAKVISEQQSFALKPSVWDKLPPWFADNLRSSRAWKMLIRCWVASWVGYIIILPHASLSVLGSAGFFALLASFMIPPNMPVQLFLFALTTVVMGLCLGWSFGVAAMRAALASRDQLLLKQSLLQEQQSVAGLSNPEALFQADIFAGKFLDTRSSVVFGCFLGLGTFFFALIRAYAPKLIIMSIFATIALDIFCTFGALFPFAQYTILNSFLISVACYVAIGIVVIIFIFPETINHAALISTADIIGDIKSLVDMQQKVLESYPDDLAPDSDLYKKLYGVRAGIIGKLQQLVGSTAFIGLEFSWGKWNGDDVKSLHEPLTSVVTRTSALQSFVSLAGRRLNNLEHAESESSDAGSEDTTTFAGDTYLLRQLREQHLAAETKHSVRLQDIMPVIESATLDLRAACSDGLASTKALIDGINKRRYSRAGPVESDQHLLDLDNSLDKLRAALANFKETQRLQLVTPFQSILEHAKENNLTNIPLRSLYISYVYAANLIVLVDAVVGLMEYVQTTAGKRKRNRLWAPGGMRAIGKALRRRGDFGDQAVGEDKGANVEDEVEMEQKPFKLDPDSKPPTNIFQRVANGIHVLYKWTKTPEALFTFRYAALSVALYIPAVCKTSARFYYVQKGLWSLIMAQTTLNIYASDQIFNYFTRILGTFFGAVLGLLGWYIGDGKGTGNPYGSAAVMAVFLIPLVFLRLFSPPQYLSGILLLCVTFLLVMGYSWIDGNLPTFGNPGIGWDVAWKRFVTVLIGCAASFIMMMLPPKSGRKAVRLRNASTLTTLSYLYSDLVSAWIKSEGGGPDSGKRGGTHVERIAGLRNKMVDVAGQLQAVKTQTAIAKWEGSIRGAWPSAEYMKIADLQSEILASLALLGGALARVDSSMRVSFLHHTSVVNPNFISDVMATFFLTAQTLRTGEPMPQAFHQNLFERLIHHHHVIGRVQPEAASNGGNGDKKSSGSHLDMLSEYEYIFFATAVSAVFQVIHSLNELRAVVVGLCGEAPLQGYSTWKNEFDRAQNIA